MKDRYLNFKSLETLEMCESFHIECVNRRSSFLIFSPHGGGIEQGTSEICKHIANNAYSFYLFEGKGNNCGKLHITSANFDEPKLIEMLSRHKFAISIHGMTNKMQAISGVDVFLGGLNQDLIQNTTKILREYYFGTRNNLENPGSPLSGMAIENITNKCLSGKGMQIEISEYLRARFFLNDFRKAKNRINGKNQRIRCILQCHKTIH